MMELNGAKVKHKTFGCGLIEGYDGKYFSVHFEHMRKDFVYPDAFKLFLEMEDPTIHAAIQSDLAVAQESISAAENARRQFSLFQVKEQQTKTAKKPRGGQRVPPACGLVKSPSGQQYFFVVQNRTFDVEHEGGYLWAPKPNVNGRDLWHWKLMGEVHAGDVVFHIVDKNIVAISVASAACYGAQSPGKTDQEPAAEDAGRRVDSAYHMLETPIAVSDFRNSIVELQPAQYAPFNALGRGNTGYLFASNPALSQFLFNKMMVDNKHLEGLAGTLGLNMTEVSA